MKIWDRMTERFRRKQQEEAIVDTMVARQYKQITRPQHGTGHATTHSKRLRAARKASRR